MVEIDISDLVDHIDDDIRATERVVEELVKATTREFVISVIPATPVDTGKARRNWQVQFLNPATQVLNGEDKSSGGQFTVAEQIARTNTYRFGRNGFAPAVWITNNVPYIVNLNEGSSLQAPAGFVEISLQRAARAAPRRLVP